MRARLTVALIAPLLVLVACSTQGVQPTASPPARGPEAPAAGQPPDGAAQTDPGFGVYVVQPGDFLTQIAEALEVPIEELTALNGITNPTLIQVGQKLRYPLPSPPETSSAPEVETPASGGSALPGRPVSEAEPEAGSEQSSAAGTSSGDGSPARVAPQSEVAGGASSASAVATEGSGLPRLPLSAAYIRLGAIVLLSSLMLAALLLGTERFVMYAAPPAGAWVWEGIGGLALAQRRLVRHHIPRSAGATDRSARAGGRRARSTGRWLGRRTVNAYVAVRWSGLAVVHVAGAVARGAGAVVGALRWSGLAVVHVLAAVARGARTVALAIGRATGGTGRAFWRVIMATGRALWIPVVLLGRAIAATAFALGLVLAWLWRLLGPIPGMIGRWFGRRMRWFGRVLAAAGRAFGGRGRAVAHRGRVVVRRIEPYLPRRRSTPRHTAWRDLSHVDSVDELRLGIEAGELRVQYLPGQHAGDGGVAGVEARVRWQHPSRGLLEADQFMPLTSADPEVGRTLLGFVLSEGARFLVGQQGGAAGQLSLFVGVTREQLLDPQLPELVRSSIASTQLPAGSIELGVLERDVVSDFVQVVRAFEGLAATGVGRVIDQYGDMTVEQLRQLRPSSVRVNFRASTKNYSAWHFVTRTVKAAASIELPVTATDVKTREEIEFALSLGCQRYQDESAAESLLERLRPEGEPRAA